MSEQDIQPIHDRSLSKAHLVAKVIRYRNLIFSKWWIPPVTIGIGVGVGLWLSRIEPASFVSAGRMIVSIKLAIPEGSVYTEELSNFLGTQAALMQSGVVIHRAHSKVMAERPDATMRRVSLKVSVLPKTTIFVLQSTGEDPQYTQAFLQSSMEEYVLLKKEMRMQTSDTTVAGLTEEVLRLEKELHKSDQELMEFQSTNSVVLLQEQGNSAGNYLAALNQRLAALKSEYELLRMLTLDQNLERRLEPAAYPIPNSEIDSSSSASNDRLDLDYLRAKQQILLLKAEQQDLAEYLRPKHPKMIAMSDEIAHRERLLGIYRQQSADQLETRKGALALQIRNLEKDVQEWDARTLDFTRKSGEYLRLKGNSQRIQGLYDRLLATMQTLDVNKEISPESVTIMEKASSALADRSKLPQKLIIGGVIGLACAVLLLLLLDRLDDRLNSFTELQDLFDENVLGQIPREKTAGKGAVGLIAPEDERHTFVEAYRNLRSSLLYMTESSARPKTILITSSIPNEGKSVTSGNFAITMANTGSKVLLVDADLRKGVLHERFGLESGPGFSEALNEGGNWTDFVQPTGAVNVSLLARGTTQRSSDYFMGQAAQKFLKEAAAQYDYVIFDTAPVMAADDVTSFAPHLDGVLFVIRAEHTSARVSRAALELLYQRNVRVLGLVFNAVRPFGGDYYYYQYKDYYHSYPSSAAGGVKA